jgi:hypothetical protein
MPLGAAVDEHIEPAEAILDQLPRSLERCGRGNVDDHHFNLCAVLRKHRRGLPARALHRVSQVKRESLSARAAGRFPNRCLCLRR